MFIVSKGNVHLKDGKYDLAYDNYSKAMELDPSNPVYPANRAVALLKLEQWVIVRHLAMGSYIDIIKACFTM